MTDTSVETDQAAREATGAHPYGRYLEEFEVGAVYKHWPAKTVTESDDHLFCLITMNHHPLHINDVYAKGSQQGRNVVVGPLVYSLALGMSVSDVSGKAIANLATEELKHPAPVFHGDTLFCESEVLEVKPSQVQGGPGHGQGAHSGAQPGRRAGGRVQAPGARAAQGSRGSAGRRREQRRITRARPGIFLVRAFARRRPGLAAALQRIARSSSDSCERSRAHVGPRAGTLAPGSPSHKDDKERLNTHGPYRTDAASHDQPRPPAGVGRRGRGAHPARRRPLVRRVSGGVRPARPDARSGRHVREALGRQAPQLLPGAV